MIAYEFNDYWKDVGTISSLWEANMDILNPASGLNLDDKEWRIFARNSAEPPQFVSSDAVIKNSVVSEGTFVQGEVKNSVISYGCTLGKNCRIVDSILMPGAVVEDDAVVEYAIVGWDAKVGKGARVGEINTPHAAGEWEIAVVGPEVTVKPARSSRPAKCSEVKTMINNAMGILIASDSEIHMNELTIKRTSASLPYGGRYRMIDFALSNLVNSGISTIGIVTRNNYNSLMDHLRMGRDWDLNRKTADLRCSRRLRSTPFATFTKERWKRFTR